MAGRRVPGVVGCCRAGLERSGVAGGTDPGQRGATRVAETAFVG